MKKFFVLIIALVFFVFFAAITVIGVGNNYNIYNEINIERYAIKPLSITLNKKTGEDLIVKVYIVKEDKINDIPIEDYVKGVVAAEMPAEFNTEALKAQAVAVRTFTLAHMEEFDGAKCSEAKGGDLCDSSHCQVYVQKEEKLKQWIEAKRDQYWEKIEGAVNSTKGQILTYDNKLVMSPYYFASSSGKTENSEEVFNDSEPYLVSVNSPGEESAPKYKTSVTYSYKDFLKIVNNAYNNAKLTENKLKNQVKIMKRTKGAGSVLEIKLGNVTISGTKFRTMCKLNSTNFSITFGKSVIINCIGYGHDVGMSQYGANVMAQKGENYVNILKHYYKGIEVQKMDYL